MIKMTNEAEMTKLMAGEWVSKLFEKWFNFSSSFTFVESHRACNYSYFGFFSLSSSALSFSLYNSPPVETLTNFRSSLKIHYFLFVAF